MLPFAARRLRRLARAARALGNDPTDYSISWTASSFVAYYAQRISSAIVFNTARGVHKSIAVQRAKRRKACAQAEAARRPCEAARMCRPNPRTAPQDAHAHGHGPHLSRRAHTHATPAPV